MNNKRRQHKKESIEIMDSQYYLSTHEELLDLKETSHKDDESFELKELKNRRKNRKHVIWLTLLGLFCFIFGLLFNDIDNVSFSGNMVRKSENEAPDFNVNDATITVVPAAYDAQSKESIDAEEKIIKSYYADVIELLNSFRSSARDFSSAFFQSNKESIDGYHEDVLNRLFPKVIDTMSQLTDRCEERFSYDDNVTVMSMCVISLLNLRLDISKMRQDELKNQDTFLMIGSKVLTTCREFDEACMAILENTEYYSLVEITY